MKIFFLIACFLSGFYSYSQNPFLNTTWNASKIIGTGHFGPNTDIDYEPVSLDTLNKNHPYGNITTFTNDHQFTSRNQGWCGNECRITVAGTYTVTGNTIALFVQSISYHKMCSDKPKEEINTLLGVFYWKQEGAKIILNLKK